MKKSPTHSTHPGVVKRLRRASGHLNSVIGMIEDERSCVDIAQQLHAVEKAIAQAKRIIIHDHLDHCLEEAAIELRPESRAAIDGFRDITRYL